MIFTWHRGKKNNKIKVTIVPEQILAQSKGVQHMLSYPISRDTDGDTMTLVSIHQRAAVYNKQLHEPRPISDLCLTDRFASGFETTAA